MKTKLITSIFFASTVALLTTSVMAQSVEYDDMYFNGKDRKKLREKQAAEQASFSQSPASRHNKSSAMGDVYADADNGQAGSSYAARNQNPEFTARASSKEAAEDSEYFSSSYTRSPYASASNLKNFDNSYNTWFNSPWVANNYWGSSIYGWNSPYYGSAYDTWGSPWCNPYYSSGWSVSYSFYGGNSYGYGSPYSYGGMGLGMGYGMAYSFGSPYNNYNNYFGHMGMGYGSIYTPHNGSGYGYVDYGNQPVYGKRGAQNGMVTRGQTVRNASLQPHASPSDGTIGTRTPTYNGTAGGRMAATPSTSAPSRGQVQSQDDYYNRNWRTSRQGDAYGGSNSYSQPSRSSQSGNWNNANSSSQSQYNNRSVDSGRSSYSGGTGGSSYGGGSAPASTGTRSRVRD